MTPASVFEPIGHGSIAEAVVARIEDMIASGLLKEGRRLPPERELADALQVSRPKLREALHMLEERGLVTVRHGEGTFVAPLTGKAMMPALLALYTRHEPAFFDYLEYRKAQEAFAARLAAERATSSDKDRISAIMDALRSAWEADDAGASREADLQFHTAIVDASQNATLIHMMTSIYELTRQGVFYNREFLYVIDGTGRQLLDQHVAIGNAIVSGDRDAAEAASNAHLDFVEASFRKGIEQSRREALAAKRKLMSG